MTNDFFVNYNEIISIRSIHNLQYFFHKISQTNVQSHFHDINHLYLK